MDPQIVIAAATALVAVIGLVFVAVNQGRSHAREISDAVAGAEARLNTALNGVEERLRTDLKDAEGRLRTELQDAEGRLRTELQASTKRLYTETDRLRNKFDELTTSVWEVRGTILNMPRLPENLVTTPGALFQPLTRPAGIQEVGTAPMERPPTAGSGTP